MCLCIAGFYTKTICSVFLKVLIGILGFQENQKKGMAAGLHRFWSIWSERF